MAETQLNKDFGDALNELTAETLPQQGLATGAPTQPNPFATGFGALTPTYNVLDNAAELDTDGLGRRFDGPSSPPPSTSSGFDGFGKSPFGEFMDNATLNSGGGALFRAARDGTMRETFVDPVTSFAKEHGPTAGKTLMGGLKIRNMLQGLPQVPDFARDLAKNPTLQKGLGKIFELGATGLDTTAGLAGFDTNAAEAVRTGSENVQAGLARVAPEESAATPGTATPGTATPGTATPETATALTGLVKQYTDDPDRKKQALAYADKHGLDGVEGALRHRLEKRQERSEWASRGGAGAAYAQARGLMVQKAFEAAKVGSNEGITASTQYNASLRALPGLLRKHGPDVTKFLSSPEALKAENPEAYNELSSSLGLLSKGDTAAVTASELLTQRTSVKPPGATATVGEKYSYNTSVKLSAALQQATTSGALDGSTESMLRKAVKNLPSSGLTNPQKIRDYEEQYLKPALVGLQSVAKAAPVAAAEKRKNYATWIAGQAQARKQLYTKAAVQKAAAAADKSTKGLTPKQAWDASQTIYDRLRNPDELQDKFDSSMSQNKGNFGAALDMMGNLTGDEKRYLVLTSRAFSGK